ncbi:MAG: carbon starvation protein A [Candidatus Omnitrophica bacterium]|nr:carbon starvation protein A [Candidatus Omnitrophota bacterium]
MIIFLISLAVFALAYFLYGKFIAKLFGLDKKRDTPAFTNYDGVDYVPAKNWLVLYGHHFASIAGAGPIIGPVIAAMLWGWLPALLWVVLGSVFFGGIHDFGSLLVSVKENGVSVADIAERAISKKAKIIFSLFVWLALILVIAVFAYLCADTFVKQPRIVLPSLGLIPVAMIVGHLLYNLRSNSIITTIFGLTCLVVLMVIGNSLPFYGSVGFWMLILFVYCYLASVLPVNILLQPRDYLSSFLLFFGVGAGFAGLIISNPSIAMPPYMKWNNSQGQLWPMLFVTVACGAISGFHALIASGTTSKQIANESYARRVGYGGVLAEGLVAVLAIISVAIIFGPRENFAAILKSSGPINIFGKGYGFIARPILGGFGTLIAITILNAFILTTLDTATRILRYLTEELFKIKNRFFSTFVIIVLSAALAYSGQWAKIWSAFGASNQLVAALALFVLSCWLLAKGKNVVFTLIPALFMFITTVAALVFQGLKYFAEKNITLLAVTVFLLVLAAFMAIEVVKTFLRKNKSGMINGKHQEEVHA